MILSKRIWIFIFVLQSFLSFKLWASEINSELSHVSQTTITKKIETIKVQEMLFDINGAAVTTYDFKIFNEEYAKTEIFLPETFQSLFKTSEDQFLVLKLVQKEAEQLGLDYDTEQYSQITKTQHKLDARDLEEIKSQLKTINLLGLKQKQLQDRQTVLAWLQILKRKYLLNVKSEDFKAKLSIRI